MRELWEDGLLPRVLLLGVLIALLGLFPLSKAVTTSLERARRAQEAANPGAVAANLATVARQQPWRTGYWEAAGYVALAADDPQFAGEYFSQAAARGELTSEGYLAWGDADWQADSPQTALQIWAIAERLGAAPQDILPRRAEVYRAVGDDLALIDILKAISTDPLFVRQESTERAALYHELGLLLAAYDSASAPAYLSQAMELDPDLEPQIRSLNFAIQQELSQNDPVYLFVIAGRALANLGRWDLAERAFANATRLNQEYAEAWAYLGEARQHTLAYGNGLTALRTALELDPQSVAANTFMALFWQRQEEPETALKYLQTAAELDPHNPALLAEVGNLTALLGDLEAGREAYLQAIALNPTDPTYVREFLEFSIRYNLNLREVALPVARRLILLNPEDPASLDVMGEVLFQLGDTFNAERFYFRALEQNQNFDQAHLHLGGLYLLQGNLDLAEYHYQRVLALTDNARTMAQAQQALDEYFSP